MIHFDPDKRPTVKEIIHHPWMTKFNDETQLEKVRKRLISEVKN